MCCNLFDDNEVIFRSDLLRDDSMVELADEPAGVVVFAPLLDERVVCQHQVWRLNLTNHERIDRNHRDYHADLGEFTRLPDDLATVRKHNLSVTFVECNHFLLLCAEQIIILLDRGNRAVGDEILERLELAV